MDASLQTGESLFDSGHFFVNSGRSCVPRLGKVVVLTCILLELHLRCFGI